MIGGLGSLWGALAASLLIGWMQTFAASYNVTHGRYPDGPRLQPSRSICPINPLADLWSLTLPQIGPILPYLLMVLVLVIRPQRPVREA